MVYIEFPSGPSDIREGDWGMLRTRYKARRGRKFTPLSKGEEGKGPGKEVTASSEGPNSKSRAS